VSKEEQGDSINANTSYPRQSRPLNPKLAQQKTEKTNIDGQLQEMELGRQIRPLCGMQ
jgi:hypothetical protein